MPVRPPLIVPHRIDGAKASKARLSTLVNEQAHQIVALTQQKHGLMVLLAAMVRHPDALTMDADGKAWLERAAIQELKTSTTLQTYPQADRVLIKVIESDYILRAEPFSIGTTVNPVGNGSSG